MTLRSAGADARRTEERRPRDVQPRRMGQVEPLCHAHPDDASDDVHRAMVPAEHQTRGDLHVRSRTAPVIARLPTDLATVPRSTVPISTGPITVASVGAAASVIELEFAEPHPVARALKRAIDVTGAAIGLVLALPVLLVLAALIKLDSPGSVFFAHDRIGSGGRRFRCYKLRTMCADAEARLHSDPSLREAHRANHFKLPAHVDERITALGRFLRTTSLDEIPQFWNVLRGDMSLVGPRPVVADELVHYGSGRTLLLSVRPGVTGAWAVCGRSSIGYPQRATVELDYVRHWTLGRDLRILVRTVGVVLQRRGAY